MAEVGVYGTDQQLVAQNPVQVDMVTGHFDLSLAAGDAGPDDTSVVTQDLHRFKRNRAAAGGFDDQIGLTVLLSQLRQSMIDVLM